MCCCVFVCCFCLWLSRDTLAANVPCLSFLSQPPRKDCISVSNSECSFRESMLSRTSSGSKNKFYRISSMSTGDTVCLFVLVLELLQMSLCVLLSQIYLGAERLKSCQEKSAVFCFCYPTGAFSTTDVIGSIPRQHTSYNMCLNCAADCFGIIPML